MWLMSAFSWFFTSTNPLLILYLSSTKLSNMQVYCDKEAHPNDTKGLLVLGKGFLLKFSREFYGFP